MNQFLKRFVADRSGNILIMTGIGFLFLVAIGGAGYDLGRQQLVQQRIQQASDAAAVAAAGMEYGATTAQRTLMAQNIYNLNFPDQYLGVARADVVPTIVVDNASVRVSANTTVATSFVRNFNNGAGPATLAADGVSRTQIKVPPLPIDLILVMDVSGSMDLPSAGPWLDPVIDPITGLAVCATEERNYYLSFFTPDCAVSFAIYGYASPAACVAGRVGFFDGIDHFNTVCRARFASAAGAKRINAMRAAAVSAVSQLLNPNLQGNRVALITWDTTLHLVKNFSNNFASVKSDLLAMLAIGATDSTVGLAQAKIFMASLNPTAIPVVILLTDGANNSPTSNPASVAICDQLKATPKTLVFTIAFGSDAVTGFSAPIISQFLSDCATGPNGAGQPNKDRFYFPAANGAALNAAFTSILDTVRKVRILQ
jgi:Flp pilus assembly protein TadG